MKKLFLLFVSAAAIFFAACSSEYDDTKIWNSINSLEQRMSAMETVMNAYKNDLHIKSVNQIEGGYVILFSDGSQATIMNGKDGEDGKDGVDGKDGEDGKDGVDGKDGADGDTYIESITIGENEVTFILTDGKSFSIPLYSALSITFDADDLIVMNANTTRDIHYTVESILDDIKVEVVSSADIKAKVIPNNNSIRKGVIWVNTGDKVDEFSKIVIFVSNEEKVIMRSFTFEEAGLEVSDNVEKQVQAEGGDITLEFMTNDDYEVLIEPEAQSWIMLTESRALTNHQVSLKILPNEGAPRNGKVSISSASKPDLYVEYIINQSAGAAYLKKTKQISALRALYEATDGDNWRRKDNWFTDKPLYEWYGLNKMFWPESTIKVDEVVQLDLSNNNLRGTLPPELADLMDDATKIELSNNVLYGPIHENIRNHSKWQRFGWEVLMQNTYSGGGFDFSEGTGLILSDGEMTFFVDDTYENAYDVLKENELTLVINAGGVVSDFEDVMGIADEWVNYFLGYQNKGLGMIVTVSHNWDVPYDGYKNYVLDKRAKGFPTDIMWSKNPISYFVGLSIMGIGEMHLFDKYGNLLSCWNRDWALPDTWYINQIDPIVRDRLGGPEEHSEYVSELYTSTDYSRDGEVVTLQKATKGKGIDLVFMGDAYVDKHMDDGDKYEREMRKSMEYFFETEPYKSLRDRFNVYAVKVVSPNYEFTSNSQHRINYDNNICFEYASKINGIDLDKVTIVNVVNSHDDFFVSGYTNMYESGASVAHIELGGPSSIIVHEAGGHGFAKLLDEYIYGGYENNIIPESEVENFNTFIKMNYHNRGWGVNVDTTNDPEKILWLHFLNDSRYSDEVGIYQGAWLYPYNLWRSSENSIMNDTFAGYFNAPSREAIYKAVMKLSEGDDWVYDYEEFVRFDKSVSTRSAQHTKTTDNRQIKRKEHKAPTIIKGSWRDAK